MALQWFCFGQHKGTQEPAYIVKTMTDSTNHIFAESLLTLTSCHYLEIYGKPLGARRGRRVQGQLSCVQCIDFQPLVLSPALDSMEQKAGRLWHF